MTELCHYQLRSARVVCPFKSGYKIAGFFHHKFARSALINRMLQLVWNQSSGMSSSGRPFPYLTVTLDVLGTNKITYS